ncbi:MAG TPA: SMI1/KNR4 family protein [Gemmatimonadales bacterium]|nr:SMI1/KNR4 family protein [Gemmatimonadales bacterium]
MTHFDWSGWLRTWNEMLLGPVDPEQPDTWGEDLTAAVVQSGWLGSPGATEEQVAALEARLGTSLPPSYRSFLRTSNGFLQPNVLVPRLLPIDEVDWFRAGHQDVIDSWNLGIRTGGAAADDPRSFEHFLPTALQVSAIEHAGSAVYLLNPKVVSAEGEWEAFYFAHWIPGVNRYPSFSALLEAEMSGWEPPGAPTAPVPRESHSDLRTWWETVRWVFGKRGSGAAG